MPALSQLAFDVLARDKASATLDKVGSKAESTGKKVESGSHRGANAFRLLGDTFASSSAGALGPLQELTNKFDLFTQATETGGSKAGGRLLGIGLAATAAGSFIESLHSKEQGALQQLQTSIETTGQSYDTYREDVEKAVKSGERFGNTAGTTADALNRLVTTTHNPAEAFKGLSVAVDVAAEKHITLSKAAELVGLTFNGSTRAGKQFGLQLENTTGAVKALDAAQKTSASAVTAVKNAQTTYTEKLAEWNASSKHTVAQAYALRDAHTKLLDAQDKASAAAARLKTAQEKASAAADAGKRNVEKLAAVVKGQGAASADTFTGHLKAMGASIEDTLGANGKLGGTLVTFGIVASAAGALSQTFLALRTAQVTSSAEGAAAVSASAAEIDTALASEVAAAEGAAAAVSTASKGMIASLTALAGPLAAAGAAYLAAQQLGKDGGPLGKGSAFGNFVGLGGDVQGMLDEIARQKKEDADNRALAMSGAANNSGDDKLAMQRLAHTLTGTKKAAAKGGKDSGDAYLKGLLGQIGSDQAASAARDAAAKNAQSVVDAISGVFQKAQGRLQSLVQSSLSLRQSVTSSLEGGSALTDIFQGPDLNANGAFGRQNNFGRVRDFLQRRVAQERRFVLELRALMKQGLDPSLVAQIAGAGVDGGQRIAEAILSGGKGGIGQVNSLERQIASLANTTGKSVADQHYATQIAEQRRNTEVIGSQLAAANAKLAAIQGNTTKSSKTDASLVGI